MGRVSGVTGRLQGPAAVQQRGRTHRQEPCCVDIQERDRQCLDRTESLANQIGGRKVSEGDGQQTAEGVTHALIGCEEELPLRSRGWGVEGGSRWLGPDGVPRTACEALWPRTVPAVADLADWGCRCACCPPCGLRQLT
jgi:hypothetical protein